LSLKETNQTMKFLTAIACLAISSATFAQAPRDPKAPEMAVRQAAEISQMLGLDDATNQQLTKALMASSDQTNDLRVQCAKIQTEVDAIYQKNMAGVMATLTPAQMERYQVAVKDGRIKLGCCDMGSGGCSMGASGSTKAAGCEGAKAEGKPAGACCAGGKAHSEAKPADQKAAPEKK